MNTRCMKTYNEAILADQEKVVVVRMTRILINHSPCKFSRSLAQMRVNDSTLSINTTMLDYWFYLQVLVLLVVDEQAEAHF